MDRFLIFFFLAAVLSMLAPGLQEALRRRLHPRPQLVFAAPVLLSAIFLLFLLWHGAANLAVALLIVAYTVAPTALVYGKEPGGGPYWIDLAAIILLWMPLELGLGAAFIPRPLQGTAHTLAYGVAITLALWLFLIYRNMPGMKYGIPRGARDFFLPLAGLLVVAPVLIYLALRLSFIQPFHVPPELTGALMTKRYLLILAGVALPEEILFRALIQNWLMQRFGFHWKTLLAASIIFGAAHLNNAPGGFPNWRYMFLATIAGVAYGKVFQESGSILSSASLHAAVNTIRHSFF